MSTPRIQSYADAAAFLAGGRDPLRRPLPGLKGTELVMLQSLCIALRYHGTPVVTYSPDGTITVRTGGFHTLTTRDRISTFTPRRASAAGIGRMQWGSQTYLHDTATLSPGLGVTTDYSEARQAENMKLLAELKAEADEILRDAKAARIWDRGFAVEYGGYSRKSVLSTLVRRSGLESPRAPREGY